MCRGVTKYLLDANIFISKRNGIIMTLMCWDWLIDQYIIDKVVSIDKVYIELDSGNDELASWIHLDGSILFEQTNPIQTREIFDQFNAWLEQKNYEPMGISTFFDCADSWLVAHALLSKLTVVTLEKASDSKAKVKIPNVCKGFEVRYMTPFDLLRAEKAIFVLESK